MEVIGREKGGICTSEAFVHDSGGGGGDRGDDSAVVGLLLLIDRGAICGSCELGAGNHLRVLAGQ